MVIDIHLAENRYLPNYRHSEMDFLDYLYVTIQAVMYFLFVFFKVGVIRVNCVDCLDRTNIAQFVVGKHVLGLQVCSSNIHPCSLASLRQCPFLACDAFVCVCGGGGGEVVKRINLHA